MRIVAFSNLLALILVSGIALYMTETPAQCSDDVYEYTIEEPFKNVAVDGTAVFTIPLFDLFISPKVKIPITAIFSTKNSLSPLGVLGYGWSIPIFESCVFQLDERKFRVFLPNGSTIDLKREKNDATSLYNTNGWKGQISDSLIRLRNEEYGELVFKNGKLFSITIEDQTTRFIYSKDKIELIEGGNRSLALSKNDESGDFTIYGKGTKIDILRAKRPVISDAAGGGFVSAVSFAPTEILRNDKMMAQFSYSEDPRKPPQITMNDDLGHPTNIEWSPLTGMVSRINTKTYSTKVAGDDIQIEQKSQDGIVEIWKNNNVLNRMSRFKNGKETIAYAFAGNPHINGVTRKIIEKQQGKEEVVYSLKINEKFAPLQRVYNQYGKKEVISYEYDSNGVIKERLFTVNGEVSWKEVYKNGILQEKIFPGGSLLFQSQN